MYMWPMGISSDSKDFGGVLSKIATNGGHGEDSPYFDGWKAYEDNPFHPTRNCDGVIQMGLAENQLCFDLIEDWIKNNPKASICTADGIENFRKIANFQDYHGLPEFRHAIARFMTRIRGGRVEFDADRIVMSGGCTAASETLMFCLADPRDAFLVPSPYYPGFNRDIRWRTGVQLIPIDCHSSNNFQLTLLDLESAYARAIESGIHVKGLILTNPSNPLGTTLDRTTLRDLLEFTSLRNIHIVCDEIYSATVFTSPGFTSVSEVMPEVERCNPNLVHIIYSLSKDMGLPGFRVGVIYSYNDTVVSVARKMSSFSLVSSQTQILVASILSDGEFVEKFLHESSCRLRARHGKFVRALGEVGIRTLEGNAGLFFWMDLRHFLKEGTFEDEMRLWRVIVHEVRLNVSPGSSFGCSEPGFFRVCFANMDDATVEVALGRIKAFVSKRNNNDVEKKKRWGANKKLRLSLKSIRFNRDIRWRTGIQLIPIDCHSSNNFQLTLLDLESAYATAIESGIHVKGLILTNPSNPLGTTLDRTTLRDLLEFTSLRNIHIVCDEIYSATVFTSPGFTSVSKVMLEVERCNPKLVHIIYSLSKDMGLPGFRVGVIYSYNDTVVSVARKMSSFSLVSSQTQILVASILSDGEFVEKFLHESSCRLRARHGKFVRALGEVGIRTLEGNAGLFFWMDLWHFLKEGMFEDEMRLWRVIVHEVRLNVSPGSSFGCSEPGFFRVCFANMDDVTVEVALGRIKAFVSKRNNNDVEKKKRWGANKKLRLSLKSIRYDENNNILSISSPHMKSPC